MYDEKQLQLFQGRSINPTAEIKRQIRLAMSGSRMSRDEIVDEMNRIAGQDGIKGSVSKATLDSWCKDDPSRLPSLPWLVVFCSVLRTAAPVGAMVEPLGYGVIGPEDVAVLKWAREELARRKATKRARLALESLEVGI
jgi:hypothetical protein